MASTIDPTPTTALTNSNNNNANNANHHHQQQHLWPTQILPATLHSQNLKCHTQTPTSAQHLLSHGQLNATDFLETSPEIERTLMEAFLEDDYEGRLHLTTLSFVSSKPNEKVGNDRSSEEEEIVGMAFWREVPSDEMKEWMDLQRISKAIQDRKLDPSSSASATTTKQSSSFQADDHHHEDLSHDARKAMKLVKSDSISWIQNALQPCNTANKNNISPIPSSSSTNTSNLPSSSASTMIQKLTHSWIKIELIAIKHTQRGHHLGHLLLGCTLAKAHALHHNEHVLLHIAGGGASKNVPAAKLYARYGFVSIPQHDEGGPFDKPDRDLYVLGNIGMVLRGLPWEEVMQIQCADDGDEEDDGEEKKAVVKEEGAVQSCVVGKRHMQIEDEKIRRQRRSS